MYNSLTKGGVVLNVDKELLKGSVALLVLSVLERDDMYGYRIIQELERLSDQTFHLNEGALYPVLHKLEAKKYVMAYWDGKEGARRRKYYHLTPKGAELFREKKHDWELFSRAINQTLNGGANNV
jgi:DNA-binding PadR family transcriptional regulator